MKKQFIIAVSSLVLASGIGASQKTMEDHCFRPAFQKKLIGGVCEKLTPNLN
ncbi:MAG: hypothetical protein ACOH2E_08580 [Candidatus Paracaedibacter sp.]